MFTSLITDLLTRQVVKLLSQLETFKKDYLNFDYGLKSPSTIIFTTNWTN